MICEMIDVDIFSDSEEDSDDLNNIVYRKPYTVRERTNHLIFWDDKEFKSRFRLSKETVHFLLENIEDIIRFPTERNHALTPMQQLLICLRFFASGNMLITVGDFAGVHKTTISKVVKRVTTAICALRQEFLNFPEGEKILICHQEFYRIAAFPRVLLAVDGTHIKIQSVGGDQAEQFRNRKGFFSLNVQVACDYRLRIRNIVARWPGSSHDSIIFMNSNLKARFDQGIRNSLLLGDSGYPTLKYLMTPVAEPRTRAEQLYNESQIRTRNVIERCIGVWKRRWPTLSLGLRVSLETTQDIIVAAAILHNIAINQHDEEPDVDLRIEEINNEIVPVENVQNNDFAYRQELINTYFAHL